MFIDIDDQSVRIKTGKIMFTLQLDMAVRNIVVVINCSILVVVQLYQFPF